MKKQIQKILQIIIPPGIGLLIIWWTMGALTLEERTAIKDAFLNANYVWIILAVIIGLLSHLSRAYRWKFLLEPMGYKPRFLNSVFAIFIAYLVNLGIPRAGEVIRATTLSKYEGIPFEKSFGTIVAERVVDLILLSLIIVSALFFQVNFFKDKLLQKIPDQPLFLLSMAFLLLSLFLVFLWRIRRSDHKVFIKIRQFIKGIWEGISSIWRMKNRWAFIAHSVFIWTMYVLMFYVVSLAIKDTSSLSFGAIISGFIGGTLGVTANGGLGTFPLAVKEILSLYGITPYSAWAFGWLMWSSQTAMIILLGLASFIGIPLYNKKYFKS